MSESIYRKELEKTRASIGREVRRLREERRWSQDDLAKRLQLSQSRLSKIEHGQSSLTAEQFLVFLKVFNASLTHFATRTDDSSSELQNALARMGAAHLYESDEVLPTERFDDVMDVTQKALASGAPRLVTALAPVLVQHSSHGLLKRLDVLLAHVGLERRFAWLLDNVGEALRIELSGTLSRTWSQRYRRAQLVIATLKEAGMAAQPWDVQRAHLDLLDPGIRASQTRDEAWRTASPISQRWGVVTALTPEDFAAALRGARNDD